jgi:hypothetical protein
MMKPSVMFTLAQIVMPDSRLTGDKLSYNKLRAVSDNAQILIL